MIAELPPVVLRVSLEVRGTPEWLSFAWAAAGDGGLVVGPPAEAARTLAAVLLRLAGAAGPPLDLEATGPRRLPGR